MDDHGFTVCAFNRTVSKVDDFLANEAKGTKIIGARSIEEPMGCLKPQPRRVVLLVKAGLPSTTLSRRFYLTPRRATSSSTEVGL